jgi:ABC-type uncharacterized transport system permease subunit
MNSVLFHSILLAYLFASLGFWLLLGLRLRWLLRVAHGLLGIGVGLHTMLLGSRLFGQTTPFWGDVSASMGLLAWAMAVAYLLAWWWYRIEALGAFVVPLSFMAMAYAGVMGETTVPLPAAFQRLWLVLHIFLAVLGYAALALTFCAGLMYLIQEHQLKSKHPGALYHRLPSLRLLDELNAHALWIGFPLLTQGILTGSLWAKSVHGSYLYWRLTSLPLLLAWLMYAVLIGGRWALGWQGKKAALAAMVGFIVVLASYFVHTL